MSKYQPIFNGPRVVLVMLLALVAVHVARSILGEDYDAWMVLVAAFIPSRYTGQNLPGGDVAKVTSFVTHMFLHGDIAHLSINCGWMLAFGTIVARRTTAPLFLALFVTTGVVGAATFLAFNWGLSQPMVGASGAISGLMGAAVRFIFRPARFERSLGNALVVPLMTLRELALDRGARLMIGSWVLINLIFGLLLGQLFSEGGIAWEAHLGGFIAGLLLFPWFASRSKLERWQTPTPPSPMTH